VAEADVTPILEACLRHAPLPLPALTLAVECIQEAQRIDQTWREKIENLIAGSEREHQRIYGEAMLVIRRRKMVSIEENRAVDPTFVTNSEYQVFLDEMEELAGEYVPDHWSGIRFPAGEGSRPVAVMQYSQVEAFCRWMTAEYGGASWKYMVPSAEQLQAVPLTDPGQQKIQDEVGCWGKEGLVGGDHNIAKLRIAEEIGLRLLIESLNAVACVKALELDRALASDLAQNRASDRARELAHDLDRVRTRAVILGRDRGLHLSRARNVALTLALARELDRDLTRARTLARDLAKDLAQDLAQDLELGRNLASDLARFVGPNLAGAYFLVRARTRALGLDPDSAGNLARNRDLMADSDFSFFKNIPVAVQNVLVNEMRKGTVVGGIRLARERVSDQPPPTAR